MAARDHQSQAWIDVAVGIGKLAGVEMAFEMVDRDQRDTQAPVPGPWPRSGRRPRRPPARAASPRRPRPGRRARRPPAQGLVDHRQDLADVGPRGDLGNHAAISLVQDRPATPRRWNESSARQARRSRTFEHRRGRLVARGLDGQKDNQSVFRHRKTVRRSLHCFRGPHRRAAASPAQAALASARRAWP